MFNFLYRKTFFNPLTIVAGLVLLGLFLFINPVSAQNCYDQFQKPIPCPEKEKGKKKTRTPIPPSHTPTATFTVTPSATSTFTPSPTSTINNVPPAETAPPPNASGFSCPAYGGGIFIGLGILGAGLMLYALTRRSARGKDRIFRRPHLSSEPESVTQTAKVLGSGGSNGSGSGFLLWLSRVSTRQTASGLPDMNQVNSVVAGLGHRLSTISIGAGAGISGSALVGSLLGLPCDSAMLVTLVGIIAGSVGALILDTLIGPSIMGLLGSNADGNSFSTFELVGEVSEDGKVAGTAGLYKNKDLE